MKCPVYYSGLPLQLLPVSYYTCSLIQNVLVGSGCQQTITESHICQNLTQAMKLLPS